MQYTLLCLKQPHWIQKHPSGVYWISCSPLGSKANLRVKAASDRNRRTSMRGLSYGGLLRLFAECGDYVKSRLPLTSFCLVILLGLTSRGNCQTFDVGGQSSSSSSKQTGNPPAGASGQSNDFSWGSGIEVARQSRAAQDALKRNDFAGALAYAQQAAKSAP